MIEDTAVAASAFHFRRQHSSAGRH
jgi:hypothetical protein